MPQRAKTTNEIALMREGGKILSEVLGKVVKAVRPGATTAELDALAERLIKEAGGEPAFKGYTASYAGTPYPSTLCASINDEVVHAPATPPRVLKDGDILSLDIGMRYPAVGGLYTDMAITVPVGKISEAAKKLLKVTRESLTKGIAAVRAGATIADIGRAVQEHAESAGFGVVRDLTGHGVGYAVHEPPAVPNYFDKNYAREPTVLNLPLAIEPMLTIGDWCVTTGDDGWTIKTVDGSLAAHFEATVVLTQDGLEILTPLIRF